MDAPERLPWTGDEDADRLLAADPLALLIGMLLDQQITMEKAFRGPYDLSARLGAPLEAAAIAEMDTDELIELFRTPPALHRFPASMAKRTQALCEVIADEYEGEAARLWEEAADGADLYKRLKALPGYGEAKARIFVSILAKRFGVRPEGWEARAADWASIADVAVFEDIAEIRLAKRAMKEAASQGTTKKRGKATK